MVGSDCPNCGTMLEPGSSFCTNCGLDLSVPAPPAFKGGPVPPAPMPPMVAQPDQVPPRPVGNGKALSVIAGVLLLFNSCFFVILGLVYVLDYAFWEEFMVYMVAGVFAFVAFGLGLTSGILAIRTSRFIATLTGAVVVLVASVIEVVTDTIGLWPFLLVLSVTSLGLVILARQSFQEPLGPGAGPVHPVYYDPYGWGGTTGARR